ADLLTTAIEEQEEAAILLPAVKPHDVIVIRRTKKVMKRVIVCFRENIPLVVGVKLFPKDGSVVFRACFTDGNWVFHVVSSKRMIGGLGSVHPPYTAHVHKKPPFLFQICIRASPHNCVCGLR